MKKRTRLARLLVGILLLCQVTAGWFAAPVQAEESQSHYESGFKAVAYYPNWYGDFTSSMQWDKLTHVNYAFALPNRNGTVDSVAGSAWVINSLITAAHAHDVKVNVAVGGWSYSDGSQCSTVFEAATNTDAKCRSLANSILQLVDTYGFDGVDIDWEYPTASSANQFTALMRYLRQGLTTRGKVLTSAVQATGGTYQTDEVLEMVDWINVMAYDGDAGSGHSPYSLIVDAFQYWNGTRGVPAQKVVLGVPFYERPNWASYASIVQADPANAYRDSAVINGTRVYYNGIETMQQKAAYAAEHAGGIMIWEISQDSNVAELSLLNAIYTAATEAFYTPVHRIPGTIPVTAVSSKSSEITYTTENGVTYAGNLVNGSYLEYQIQVDQAGTYELTLPLAAGDVLYNASAMQVKINDAVVATVPITASDSWTHFIDHTVTIDLPAAESCQVSLVSVGGACNVTDLHVTKLEAETPVQTEESSGSTGEEPPVRENLATGKVVVASGSENEETEVSGAVDGDLGTRWSSNFADDAWIMVDLGGMYDVDQVVLTWEAAYGTDYEIQTSVDGSSWTTMEILTGQDGGVDTISFNSVTARYVKVQGVTRALPYGYSLWELGVYGEPTPDNDQEPADDLEEPTQETWIVPSMVTGVKAVYDNGAVQVTWDDNQADMYKVVRSDGKSGYVNLTYSATKDGWTDTKDLIEGQLYYYRVIGYFRDAEGQLQMGDMSDTAAVVVLNGQPSQVNHVTASVNGKMVTLCWDKASNVRYYKVSRAAGAAGKYYTMQYNLTEQTYTETVSASNTYRYKVVGYYKAVNGDWVYGALSDTLYVTVK